MILFVTGAPGSGKTTIGELIKKRHGYCHFDGDAWMMGLDGVEQSAETPTPEQVQCCRPAIATARDAFLRGYWLANGEHADVQLAKEFYRLMAIDIKRQQALRPDKRFVATHAVQDVPTRRILREYLGDKLVCVVLDVPEAVLIDRKAKRLEEAASRRGMTIRDHVLSFGDSIPGDKYEDKYHTLVHVSMPLEHPKPDEPRTFSVRVDTGPLVVPPAIDALLTRFEAQT